MLPHGFETRATGRLTPLPYVRSAPTLAPPSTPALIIDVERATLAYMVRMLRLALLAIVSELAVFAVGHIAPAMRTLLLPVYILIAALFVVAMWHAARRRPGHERRHPGAGDRRHGDRRD
jgi:hypothetical protein